MTPLIVKVIVQEGSIMYINFITKCNQHDVHFSLQDKEQDFDLKSVTNSFDPFIYLFVSIFTLLAIDVFIHFEFHYATNILHISMLIIYRLMHAFSNQCYTYYQYST